MALRLRLPTIYLVDCSGVVLARNNRRLPRNRSAPDTSSRLNSLLSAPTGVPADRWRIRRLHRRRRLHAEHLRTGLYDRAGVHGDRRRGADQRREEPEDHVARHRRARSSRPHVGLRRCPGPGRRDVARMSPPRDDALAVERRRFLSRRSRHHRPAVRDGRARGFGPGRLSRGVRREPGHRAPRRSNRCSGK